MEGQIPVEQTPPKKSVFAQWWFWFLIIILAVAAAAFFFLKNILEETGIILYNDSETEQEEQSEVIAPEADEKENQVDGDFVTWDSLNIPPVFLEYTDGDITQNILGFNWTPGGVPNFLDVVNTSEEAAERYFNEAVENGWEVQWEREAQGDEETSWAINIEEDGKLYSALLAWYSEGSYLSIILTETEL